MSPDGGADAARATTRRDLVRGVPILGRADAPREPTGLYGLTVDDLRAVSTSMRRLDARLGPVHVRRSVDSHLRAVLDLGRDAEPDEQRELLRVGSETAELAGWLAFDVGEPALAERHYRHGFELARQADDPALAAWAQGNLGRALASTGRIDEALGAFRLARELAGDVGAPRLASWLSAATAWGHALSGQGDECAVQLLAAERLLDEPDDSRFPWLDFYGYSQLDKWTGRCQLAFGQSAAAARSFRTALRLLPPPLVREGASTDAELADAYTNQCDVEQACTSLRRAFVVATRTGSRRIDNRVRQVRRSLQPWARSTPVRELDYLLYA